MSDIDLKRIAKLSKLTFTDAELELYQAQVKNILGFIEELKEVDIEGVEPTSHPLPLKNVFRPDEIKPSIKIEEFLKTAPRAKGRFFEVPKVIEEKS
jgi:aspartyl-tRNA(Asn)/glutamyl-tRNA(Gln) amidotransferase subunit C